MELQLSLTVARDLVGGRATFSIKIHRDLDILVWLYNLAKFGLSALVAGGATIKLKRYVALIIDGATIKLNTDGVLIVDGDTIKLNTM